MMTHEKDEKLKDNRIKDIRNLFRLKTEAIIDRVIRDLKNLFEHGEEENYYKSVRVANFQGNNNIEYIKYESNGDRKKILSNEEHFNKIRPYLKAIINNLKKSDTQKIQLTIAIIFTFSKDNDEELVMHSKSDNIKLMIYDNVGKVIEEPFESLLNRYQIGLEKLMRGSDF